jgi:hypothetical protein
MPFITKDGSKNGYGLDLGHFIDETNMNWNMSI